jgi:hypothetical protein
MEGRKEGRKEGRNEGRKDGRMEVCVSFIRLLMKIKFTSSSI